MAPGQSGSGEVGGYGLTYLLTYEELYEPANSLWSIPEKEFKAVNIIKFSERDDSHQWQWHLILLDITYDILH